MSGAPGTGGTTAGGQAERTALAWVRTCLTFAAVVLLCTRLVAHRLGLAAAVLVAGGGWVLVLFTMAGRRYRRAAAALTAGGPVPAQVQAAALTAAVMALGGLAVVLILL